MAKEKNDIWFYWKMLTDKTIHPDQISSDELVDYNPYLMNRLLSSMEIYLQHATELTKLNLPKEVHYRYLYNLLPKKFIKVEFPRSKNKNSEDEYYVSKYFEFGTRDLECAMKILDQDTIKKIKRKFGKI